MRRFMARQAINRGAHKIIELYAIFKILVYLPVKAFMTYMY